MARCIIYNYSKTKQCTELLPNNSERIVEIELYDVTESECVESLLESLNESRNTSFDVDNVGAYTHETEIQSSQSSQHNEVKTQSSQPATIQSSLSRELNQLNSNECTQPNSLHSI